ncbi:hypothetical protein ACIQ9J_01665 [Streptomyces sp. NPDC094153]|uniref:hypothetical protein n=1 Tax=Streptomyces sp. NPDC094153 TaxID=3366058 RepID=UPI0037F125ED
MSARDKLYAYAGTPSVLPESMLDEALDTYRAEVLREAESKAREIVAKLWADGTTQKQMDRAGGARAVEWEIGRMASSTDEPAAPDFFQPGHAYTHRDGSTFRCVAVTTHPDSGERVALGWHTDTADWTFVGVRNINHWNHEYDGVEPPTETGEGR